MVIVAVLAGAVTMNDANSVLIVGAGAKVSFTSPAAMSVSRAARHCAAA
jgi:hypothetical protein